MTASIKRAMEIFRENGALTLTKKSFNYILRFLHTPHMMIKVGGLGKSIGFENLVDFTINSCAGLIFPLQDRQEIIDLLKFINKLEPRVVMEIGTASGGTLFLFSRAVPEDATLFSVDLPHGKFGGGYPSWKVPLYKSFAVGSQKIHLIRENSHSPDTRKKVESILHEKKLDFLFIDGDHTYEGAKSDFLLYKDLVKKGGVIGFHDIVVHTKESGCNVHEFWNEIKKKYRHKEIVNDWDKKMGGIGLIFV